MHIEDNKMTKYTIAQILAAWEAAYGEDMTTEYPGFMQRLKEEDEQETWPRQGPYLNQSLALARGPRRELQAPSDKLQASSCKLDKTALQ